MSVSESLSESAQSGLSKELLLYSTSGCHLCDQAKMLIWPLLTERGYTLREIDIADSDPLMERYGVRIPVLAKGVNTRATHVYELDWPFTTAQITDMLGQ